MSDAGSFTLHRELPREAAEDVLRALPLLAPPARVSDAGSGPGAESETLAAALPKAAIAAVDRVPRFVAEARDRLDCFGPRVRVGAAAIADLAGPVGLIWSAGAVWFLGVETALAHWRAALAPGGAIAVSEPVLLSDPPSAAAAAFWEGCPGVGTAEALAARVAGAGFRALGTREITGRARLDCCLARMARAARLRLGAGPALAGGLDAAEAEFARWRTAPDEIARLLGVVAPA